MGGWNWYCGRPQTKPGLLHWCSLQKVSMESPYKGKTGFKRVLNAFGYSFSGLKEAFKNEYAFRQEVFLALVLIPLTFWLEHEGLKQALMIACVFLILIVELVNSAIEATVDRISLANH